MSSLRNRPLHARCSGLSLTGFAGWCRHVGGRLQSGNVLHATSLQLVHELVNLALVLSLLTKLHVERVDKLLVSYILVVRV